MNKGLLDAMDNAHEATLNLGAILQGVMEDNPSDEELARRPMLEDEIAFAVGDAHEAVEHLLLIMEEARLNELEKIKNCVVCGKSLKKLRTHVDTCGQRCFKQLLKKQRKERG